MGSDYGVLVHADDHHLIEILLTAKSRPAHIIIAGPPHDELSNTIRSFRDLHTEVLREATNVDEARAAIECGIAGVILKGYEAGGRVGADTSFVLVQKWRRYADHHGLTLPFWVRGGIGPNTAAACAAAGAAVWCSTPRFCWPAKPRL